jgi:UDP-glucuronate 4-epimerase
VENEQGAVLVTGALGCVGAWVVRRLIHEGDQVVAVDAGDDDYRLRYLLDADELSRVTRVTGDVTDGRCMKDTVERFDVSRVIHLAGLQVPACAADPVRGARVNVVGTLNLFEATAEGAASQAPLVYASSVAALASTDDGEYDPSIPPSTHYGVFKLANEGSAAVYAKDKGRPSIGLRPYVVYGVGRDQGVTAEVTLAMMHAAEGSEHHIPFGGRVRLEYADDVAQAFVAASRASVTGAAVFDISTVAVEVADVVRAIETAVPEAEGRVTHGQKALPFPAESPGSSHAMPGAALTPTPLVDGVRETIAMFRCLGPELRR